jgi:hypothetical protein
MTIDQVKAAVEGVRVLAEVEDDDASAHAAEDQLHHQVLAAIAAGSSDASGLATEALRTLQIAFRRWVS